jgi:hypothetical protein
MNRFVAILMLSAGAALADMGPTQYADARDAFASADASSGAGWDSSASYAYPSEFCPRAKFLAKIYIPTQS